MKSTNKALAVSLLIAVIGGLITACHHHRRHKNNDRVVYTESAIGHPGSAGVDAPKHFTKTTIKM